MNWNPLSLLLTAAVLLPCTGRTQTGAWATDTAAPGLGGRVFSFAEWQGSTYAGGYWFETQQGPVHGIARWDGAQWRAVGTGVDLQSGWGPVASATVFSMCEFNGELIVAGTFDTAGGQPCNNIARWNGTAFQPLGSGLVEIAWDAEVRAVAVYQNELYAAGTFDTAGGIAAPGIARWNGVNWSAVGSGLGTAFPGTPGKGMALRVRGTELVVGGDFTQAGGVQANRVARWNGSSFQAFGAGFDSQVQAIAEFGGQLHVGGAFSFSGATPIGASARWTGTTWQPIGPGLVASQVTCLREHGGLLYACGHLANGPGLARWDGNGWTGCGSVSGVFSGTSGPLALALGNAGSDLLLGGEFTHVGTPPHGIQSIVSANVAAFDGANWHQIGRGLGFDGVVAKVVPWRSGWVAVGNFQSAGASPLPHLAYFDGDDWSPLAEVDAPLSDAVVWNGDLIVTGAFLNLDGQPIARMARFDGTSWSAFGGGINAPLAVHNGALYCGGTSQLRVWNGTAWSAVAPVTGVIDDLHVHRDGNLYFTSSTFAQYLIYRWDGAQVSQIGNANNFTRCLGSNGNDLVVGGLFSAINGTPANLLARWNGSTWTSAGIAVPGYSVDSVAELDGQLYIGINSGATTFVQRWNGAQWQALGSGLTGVPQFLFADRATASLRAFGTVFLAGGRSVWHHAEWRNQPRWQNRLHGLAGAAGIPLLRGSGPLTAASAFQLDLEGPGNSVAVLGLGFARGDQPLLGATLVPIPTATVLLLASSTGAAQLAFPWPAGMPAGLTVYAQAWLVDPSGPQGWTASNALQATAP
ncbi:MAG: hypothetical protein U1E73_13775 [Planctomycetota bacterium]